LNQNSTIIVKYKKLQSRDSYVIINFSVVSRKLLFKLILRIKISIHTKDLFLQKRKVLKNIYRNIE